MSDLQVCLSSQKVRILCFQRNGYLALRALLYRERHDHRDELRHLGRRSGSSSRSVAPCHL